MATMTNMNAMPIHGAGNFLRVGCGAGVAAWAHTEAGIMAHIVTAASQRCVTVGRHALNTLQRIAFMNFSIEPTRRARKVVGPAFDPFREPKTAG